MTHRTPPKGPNWRRDWKAAGVLSTSTAQRKAVFARDGGICARCGKLCKAWDADHYFPLHAIPPSKLEQWPDCLKFWTIDNLQTLGHDCGCHKAKSAKERTDNAKVKRIIKKRTGQHKPKGKGFPKLTEEQKQKRRDSARKFRLKVNESRG